MLLSQNSHEMCYWLFDDDNVPNDYKLFADDFPVDIKPETSPELAEVLFEGVLLRKRKEPKSGYITRYFVLHKTALISYKDQSKSKLSKIVWNFRYARFNAMESPAPEKYAGWEFSKNGDFFRLYAPDAMTFAVWKEALLRVAVGMDFYDYYTIGDVLGRGTFSCVYLATHRKSKKRVAVKVIPRRQVLKQPNGNESLRSEVELLRDVNHPNIIKMLEVHETQHSVFLVFELVEGGDLMAKLKSFTDFTESHARQLLKGLLESLIYMHRRRIVHRDLKPGNILFRTAGPSDLSPIIVDFGLASRIETAHLLYPKCGSPGFMAPEILSSIERYTEIVDVFSLGVNFYLAITGKLPFSSKTVEHVLEANQKCVIDFTICKFKFISDECEDLLRKMLEKDPAKRISAAAAVNHRFLIYEESCQVNDGDTDSITAEMKKFNEQNVLNKTKVTAEFLDKACGSLKLVEPNSGSGRRRGRGVRGETKLQSINMIDSRLYERDAKSKNANSPTKIRYGGRTVKHTSEVDLLAPTGRTDMGHMALAKGVSIKFRKKKSGKFGALSGIESVYSEHDPQSHFNNNMRTAADERKNDDENIPDEQLEDSHELQSRVPILRSPVLKSATFEIIKSCR